MNLNMREMLGGDVARLRYIKRFSTCRTVGSETVAEHTAFVVIYCALIARWVEANTELRPDVATLLERAALHDIEEARSGDFPRSFKHRTQELRDAVEVAAQIEAQDIFTSLTDDSRSQEKLYATWKHAKDDSLEGLILDFADFLSAVSFICEERKVGNFCLSQHTGTLTKYLDKFQGEKFRFLAPLVRQASTIVTEVLT